LIVKESAQRRFFPERIGKKIRKKGKRREGKQEKEGKTRYNAAKQDK